jgi:hypothetical protein
MSMAEDPDAEPELVGVVGESFQAGDSVAMRVEVHLAA